jgi:multidrug resistance efflux pump
VNLSDRRVRLLGIVILVLAVVGGAVLLAGGRDAENHIESTDAHVREQLVTIRATLESIQLQVQLTRELIEHSDRQIELSEQGLGELRRSIEIQQRLLALTEQAVGKADESVRIQRELLRIAKLTYEQVRQLNEKTPESGRAAP